MTKTRLSRNDLVRMLAAKHQITQGLANDVIYSLCEKVLEHCTEGGSVRMAGARKVVDENTGAEKIERIDLGTFKCKDTKARMARNPKTGAPVEVPSRRRLVFQRHQPLKEW